MGPGPRRDDSFCLAGRVATHSIVVLAKARTHYPREKLLREARHHGLRQTAPCGNGSWIGASLVKDDVS